MLGLRKGPGRDPLATKAHISEPTVTENINSQEFDVSERIMSPSPQTSPTNTISRARGGLFSPTGTTSMTNSFVNKRTTSYGNKALFNSRAGFGRFSNSFVREQHAFIRDKVHRELGSSVGGHAFDTSYEGLREWIRSERLTRLPHKGGNWDRVLIAAQYFAEQVHQFNRNIELFTEESGAATNLVFGQCLLLLELGYENAHALEKAFNLFYQFGLELAPLLRRADTFTASQSIVEHLGRAFADLLQIVTGISISFYGAVHSGRDFMKIDIFSSFSSLVKNFRSHVHECAQEMWNITLAEEDMHDGSHVDVLQKWLAPQDSILRFLASDHIGLAVRPEQFTCTWFQSPLNSFLKSNDNILLVEGKVGSGKTTIANWVVDRLQRPVGRKRVSSINFFFNYNVTGEDTTLAMLKTLLYQLLLQRVGDVALFNAVNEVYLESKHLLSAETQEQKMWHALTKALHAVNDDENDTLAIVIDGIYENESHKTASQRTCNKLYELVHQIPAVRLIQFSQPIGLNPPQMVRVQLSTENMLDDIRTVIRCKLSRHKPFNNHDDADQEMFIEQLLEASGGSMVWVSLTCKYLQLQPSLEAFNNGFKTVQSTDKTVQEAAKRLLVSLQLDEECKSLLSFLVAAERPLQLVEVEALLRADVGHLSMSDKSLDIQSIVKRISPFAVIGEGLIAIRNTTIKQALITISSDSKLSFHLKERHKDLLIRLFIFTKSVLRGEQEPTFVNLEMDQAESRLQSHRLLEYATRYWTIHFNKSSLHKPKGDLDLPKEFKKIFPGTVLFCLLEQACWSRQVFPQDVLDFHKTGLRVRQSLFGRDHACVLQSALSCAVLCETTLSLPTEALEWYTLAVKISQVVVGVQAEITVACCMRVLRISEPLITNKRTTIMTYREEVLLVLINSYKHRYGESSKEVLEIYKKLQEFYVSIEEETKASSIVEIIQKLTVTIYGSQSDQALSMNRKAEVLLKKHEGASEVKVFDGFLFGGFEEEIETTLSFVQVEAYIKLASECSLRGEYERAEEIYIELWSKLTEHCRHIRDLEWHEIKIKVMLTYAQFLEKRKRNTESGAVLLAIWTEYERHEHSMTKSIVSLLKDVAVCMKMVGMLTMALTVFQQCWSFFKDQHLEQTSIFREIEDHISQTSTEVVKVSTSIATSKTSSSSEIIIREVFESSISTNDVKISTTTIELCQSLNQIYFKEERWSEAIRCIKNVLAKTWTSFFSESIESITAPTQYFEECIELAIQLAHCYISQRRYEKAEDVYVRLYRVHRQTRKTDDASVIKYSQMLIAFYATYNLFTKAITFYQELLVEYRAFYGATHAMTIKTLYALGDLCRQHNVNYGYWLEYYLEIVTSLNKGQLICHEESFRALVIVAEHYYETLRFSESLVYYKSIFATFYKHGTKYKYFESMVDVQRLIEHYQKSLEETKIDIHAHVAILKELREACVKYYGASSAIAISITSVLADVCSRSAQYEFEAISFYEHISKNSSSVSTEVIRRTQTMLKTLYVKQITSASSETAVTKETSERATSLLYEHYADIRKTHSCTNEVSLACLKEIVMIHIKQGKTEVALKELKNIVVECISKVQVTSAKELIESARSIAAIYVSCGFANKGFELVRELKMQVIYKETKGVAHHGFDVTKSGRVCFAFIASLEYHLRADYSMTLAMFMSDLVAEAMYYERFVQYIKVKSRLEAVLLCGAQLRAILVRTKRLDDFGLIQLKATEYCSNELWVAKISNKSSVKVFVSTLLVYFSEHALSKSWTTVAGHAAVNRLKILLKQYKHREALELATCTFHFLMANQGLDDPSEISLGFQLCLMMAGKTEFNTKCDDPVIQKGMMDLSSQILNEVFDICKKYNFNIVRCQLSELNELVMLIGEQKNYTLLQWLLQNLWSSREGQSTWPQDTVLRLGRRLVQAQFTAGHVTSAIRLCEDIVYNVRRVHGAKHHHTISLHGLLASMYTSLATKHQTAAKAEGTKNKKREEELARLYFKKAIHVHEEVLKLIVNQDDGDDSDFDDDDNESEYSVINGTASRNGSTAGQPTNGYSATFKDKEQELGFVRSHVRSLQLAIQRYGGWHRPARDYERLTGKVWDVFGKDIKMNQEQVMANKWKIEGYGAGKAEAPVSEDGFKVPEVWNIVSQA